MNILVVDDELTHLELLVDILQFHGFILHSAQNGTSALRVLENQPIDLMLLDLVLPDIDGLEVLRQALAKYPGLVVILISGHGNIKLAVEAVKIGAHDFLEKPLEAQRILLTIRNALETFSLRKFHFNSTNKFHQVDGMIGRSQALNKLFALIDVLAPINNAILITGESGTGKELIARAIHKKSKRCEEAFVKVNCAAIPDTLIESELFGYEKGAFTDARNSKKGQFLLADKGTLFLDEIGDLSLSAQAKILRALEEGEVLPVGSEQLQQVDIRVISASNKNIEVMVSKGTFREDLFYRINIVPILVPPLRDRKEDILHIAEHYLGEACRDNDIPAKALLPDARAVLESLPWKGNVRELKNFTQRLAILVEANQINGSIIRSLLRFPELNTTKPTQQTLRQAREEFERIYIQSILKECDDNVTRTAEILGIERSHLYRKMEKLGVKEE